MTYPIRVAPLPPSARSNRVQELLSRAGPFADHNIFATLVRHSELYERWMPFGTAMLYAYLPGRDRELLILRTAFRCSCNYEWTHHCEIAPKTGVTKTEIDQVRAGPNDPRWDVFDRALVRAVDEFVDAHTITDSTWHVLAERYDDRLLIEVPMVVGHYFALAGTLNSLGVQLENTTPEATRE